MTTAIERIVSILVAAHFQRILGPIVIKETPFEFDAVLQGLQQNPDIVIVEDTAAAMRADPNMKRLQQRIEGLARFLDVIKSRRPITAVFAGPRPSSSFISSVSRVCRVLPIGPVLESTPTEVIANWLAALLPLQLPATEEPTAGSEETLDAIRQQAGPMFCDDYLAAAADGPDVVRTHLQTSILSALTAQESH